MCIFFIQRRLWDSIPYVKKGLCTLLCNQYLYLLFRGVGSGPKVGPVSNVTRLTETQQMQLRASI